MPDTTRLTTALGDRYQIERELGAGGMATVYLARDLKHEMWGRNKQNTVFVIGKSILKRDSRTHVGNLCLKHGGGGHDAAGTCQVDNANAESVRVELIKQITTDG